MARDAPSQFDGSARPRRAILPSGYWLALTLIAASFGLCAAQLSANPSAAAFLVQLVTVAIILWVAEVSGTVRRVGWIVLAAAGAAVAVVRLSGTEGHVLDVLLSGASIVAYFVAPIAIIAQQARKERVDGQTLLASIAAYILVGMFFTFVYNFIALVTAVPMFGDTQVESLASQLFFSFTTLTTTGYGNIVPVSPVGESVAIIEAITGQLFLVIAVARVVSGWRPPASQ